MVVVLLSKDVSLSPWLHFLFWELKVVFGLALNTPVEALGRVLLVNGVLLVGNGGGKYDKSGGGNSEESLNWNLSLNLSCLVSGISSLFGWFEYNDMSVCWFGSSDMAIFL